VHGFCDASEAAYGAVLYVKCVTADSAVSETLLTSESRVAPIKKQTLPRLELCGALLLARLVHNVREALPCEKMNGIYLWTDSTIVLHWLHRAPNCWKTFVVNHVAEVQDLTSVEDWRHVIYSDNPADYVSRSIDPRSLKYLDHWWSGPV
jgi:hypothetical protein